MFNFTYGEVLFQFVKNAYAFNSFPALSQERRQVISGMRDLLQDTRVLIPDLLINLVYVDCEIKAVVMEYTETSMNRESGKYEYHSYKYSFNLKYMILDTFTDGVHIFHGQQKEDVNLYN